MGTVQQDIFALNYYVKCVPYSSLTRFDHAGCRTNVVGLLTEDQFTDHEWLKEFERHHLRQSTLVGS